MLLQIRRITALRLSCRHHVYAGEGAEVTWARWARRLPGFFREQCFRLLPFAFSARSRRSTLQNPCGGVRHAGDPASLPFSFYNNQTIDFTGVFTDFNLQLR
jgi:hypothetical protein